MNQPVGSWLNQPNPHSDDARDWAAGRGRGLVALTAQSVADVEFLKPKYFLGRRIRPVSFRIELTSQLTGPEVKKDFWRIFNNIEAAPGEAAIAVTTARARTSSASIKLSTQARSSAWSRTSARLHCPVEDWERVRHTNLLERTFGESRRRTKVIGRLPGGQTCLSLVWAVLDRTSQGWRGLEMTPVGVRRLQDLRRQMLPLPALAATR